jgi:hypothetical protein
MGCGLFTRKKYDRDVAITVKDRQVTFRITDMPAKDVERPTKVGIRVPAPKLTALTEDTLAAHSVSTSSKK